MKDDDIVSKEDQAIFPIGSAIAINCYENLIGKLVFIEVEALKYLKGQIVEELKQRHKEKTEIPKMIGKCYQKLEPMQTTSSGSLDIQTNLNENKLDKQAIQNRISDIWRELNPILKEINISFYEVDVEKENIYTFDINIRDQYELACSLKTELLALEYRLNNIDEVNNSELNPNQNLSLELIEKEVEKFNLSRTPVMIKDNIYLSIHKDENKKIQLHISVLFSLAELPINYKDHYTKILNMIEVYNVQFDNVQENLSEKENNTKINIESIEQSPMIHKDTVIKSSSYLDFLE